MNTSGLTRQYNQLAPSERLSLILAASARGDVAERERLAQSAPKVHLRMPDHFALAQAFRELAERHFLVLLDLAAKFLETLDRNPDEEEDIDRALQLTLAHGYLFQVQLAGWRRFCAEHDFESELLWASLPGFDRVKEAETVSERAAFVPEGMARFLAAHQQPVDRLVTAEHVADALSASLRRRMQWWAGRGWPA